MNNFIFIFNLKNYQLRLFKIVYISLIYLIIFLSAGLFFSQYKYLNLLGFWLFTIYFLELVILKYYPLKNLNFEKTNQLESYLDNPTKFSILNALLESPDISKLDISIINQLLNFKEIIYLLNLLEIEPKKFKSEIYYLLKEINLGNNIDLKTKKKYLIFKNLNPILINAYQLSETFNFFKITPIAIFLSILERNSPIIERLLVKFGIDYLDIYASFLIYLKFNFAFEKIDNDFLKKIKIFKNKNFIFIGHNNEFEQILKSNFRLILLGNEEIGKKTLIYRLAYLIENKKLPEEYLDKKIYQLELKNIKTENELNLIFNQGVNDHNSVIFIPDLSEEFLIKYQKILKEFLRNSELKIILTLTSERLIKINNLEKFFKIITINDFTEKDVLTILAFDFKDIFIQPKALRKIVGLANNYLRNNKSLLTNSKNLLQKSVNFCKKNNFNVLTDEIVGDIFSKFTSGFIFNKYSSEDLEEIIHQRLVNQEIAVKNVAKILTSLNNKKIISFLFMGPKETGKKELTKILASIYFGSDDNIIYFDLDKIKKIEELIGNEKEEGNLIKSIKYKPFSIILFENFEKINEELSEFLVQIITEGYFKNFQGKLIDLKQNLIIAISNIYFEFIEEEIKKGKTLLDIKIKVKDYLSNLFSPILINKFSDIILFRPLTGKEILEILIRKNTKNNPKIIFSPSVQNYLQIVDTAKLKKIFQEEILNKIKTNNSAEVFIDYLDDQLIIDSK